MSTRPSSDQSPEPKRSRQQVMCKYMSHGCNHQDCGFVGHVRDLDRDDKDEYLTHLIIELGKMKSDAAVSADRSGRQNRKLMAEVTRLHDDIKYFRNKFYDIRDDLKKREDEVQNLKGQVSNLKNKIKNHERTTVTRPALELPPPPPVQYSLPPQQSQYYAPYYYEPRAAPMEPYYYNQYNPTPRD